MVSDAGQHSISHQHISVSAFAVRSLVIVCSRAGFRHWAYVCHSRLSGSAGKTWRLT
jgi:hypothetical protein